MSDQNDVLRRAYATLSALKNNLSKRSSIGEELVDEYHAVLDRMSAAGINVKEFRIPDGKARPDVISVDRTGEFTYSDEKFVDGVYFRVKLDVLLDYFTLTYDERKPQIGFAPV